MKKIEALISLFKFDEVKEALSKEGIQGMTVSEVKDWDRNGGPVAFYRGIAYAVEFRPRVKVEVTVEDEEVKGVTDTIIGVLRAGHLGDGQIAILPVEAVIHIRTDVRWADTMNQRNGLSRGWSGACRPHKERERARSA